MMKQAPRSSSTNGAVNIPLTAPLVPVELISRAIRPISQHYSVEQLNNLLTLAGHYMRPDVRMLFKSPPDDKAVDYIKFSVMPHLRTELSLAELQSMITGMLAQSPIQYNLEQFSHEWAKLINICFTNCELINFDANEMLLWRFFLEDLIKIYNAYLPTLLEKNQKGSRYDFSGLDKEERVQNTFLNFLARLHQIGNIKAIKAIHQLFYLVRRVGKTPASTMGLMELGTYIGPCIHFALFRNLLPKEDAQPRVRAEVSYFCRITGIMLEHPFFDQPYEQVDYAALLGATPLAPLTAEQYKERLRAIFSPVSAFSFDDPIKTLEEELRNLRLSQTVDIAPPSKDRTDQKEKNNKKDVKDNKVKVDKKEKDKKRRNVSFSLSLPTAEPYTPTYDNDRRGRLTPRPAVDPTSTDKIVIETANNKPSK